VVLGDWPIRDFVDPGMPLQYLVSAAAWKLWGGSQATELLLVSTAFAIGAAVTVQAAARLSGSLLVALLAAALEVIIAPRSYSYPKVLLYAIAAAAIVGVSASPSRWWRSTLLGAIAGVAFLFRHDHGLYIGIGAAVAVAIASRSARQLLLRNMTALVAGAAVLALPWLVYVQCYQGLGSYLRSGLEFSRAEAAVSRMDRLPRFTLSPAGGLLRLRPAQRPTAIVEWKPGTPDDVRQRIERKYQLEPVPNQEPPKREYFSSNRSETALRGLLTEPQVHDVSGLDRFVQWSERDEWRARLSPSRLEWGGWEFTSNAWSWLFYLFHLLPVAALAAAWRLWRRQGERWAGETTAVVGLAVMALLVNQGLIRGNLPVWLPDAIVPAVLLAAWLFSLGWEAAPARRAARVLLRGALTVVVLVSGAAVAAAGDLHSQLDRAGAYRGVEGTVQRARFLEDRLWRRQRDAGFSPSGVSDALESFFGYVDRCTVPTDRLLMTRLYPDVFVLAERGFAGGQVAFIPGFYDSDEAQGATLARLRQQSVPLVLMMMEREGTFETAFPRVGRYVRERYTPVAEIPVEQTAVRVFVENARAPHGADDVTGWPCFR
jgi:4-amino-4-deoxy-L-arabinose transferase-like glycosyltransferase